MNYLAHCLLTDDAPHWLEGAILGDFVKGRLERFDPLIADGLLRHRRVDRVADQSDVARRVLAEFPKSLRRAAPIVMDMLFDHALALQRTYRTSRQLIEYSQMVGQRIRVYPLKIAESERIVGRLIDHQLFDDYRDPNKIRAICGRIEGRMTRPQPLREACDYALELMPMFSDLTPALMAELKTAVY